MIWQWGEDQDLSSIQHVFPHDIGLSMIAQMQIVRQQGPCRPCESLHFLDQPVPREGGLCVSPIKVSVCVLQRSVSKPDSPLGKSHQHWGSEHGWAR